MKKLKIFLSGAMGGMTLEEMDEWRRRFIGEMRLASCYTGGIIDPVDFYNTVENNHDSDKEYFRWELRSVATSDLVIARIEDGFNSLGTMAEITTAFNCKVPVLLLVDNKDQEIHSFVEQMSDKKFELNNIRGLVKYIKHYYGLEPIDITRNFT